MEPHGSSGEMIGFNIEITAAMTGAGTMPVPTVDSGDLHLALSLTTATEADGMCNKLNVMN